MVLFSVVEPHLFPCAKTPKTYGFLGWYTDPTPPFSLLLTTVVRVYPVVGVLHKLCQVKGTTCLNFSCFYIVAFSFLRHVDL